MPGGEEGGEEHEYDEREEIMLIKVMALITKKLEAMHAGMQADQPKGVAVDMRGEPEISEPSEEPSEAPPFGGGEEEPSEEPSEAPPFGGGEEEPSKETGEQKNRRSQKKSLRRRIRKRSPLMNHPLSKSPPVLLLMLRKTKPAVSSMNQGSMKKHM